MCVDVRAYMHVHMRACMCKCAVSVQKETHHTATIAPLLPPTKAKLVDLPSVQEGLHHLQGGHAGSACR